MRRPISFGALSCAFAVFMAAGCSSSTSSDAATSCVAAEGGVQSNNASDEFNYDWTCGATTYKIDCACGELQNPPNPKCTCQRNGVVEMVFDWKCGPLDTATIAKCNYPTP